MIGLLLLCLALACFVVAALGGRARINLLPAGLACWVLSIILGGRLP